MTKRVYELLKLCSHAKTADDYLFTRSNGKPVRDFRGTWAKRVKQQESPVCYSTIFGEQQPGICAVQEPQRA